MENETEFLRLFAQLAALGEFRISRQKSGCWHAAVEFPSPEGVTALVRSDFDHKTPLIALQSLHDRLGGLRQMVNIAAPMPGIAYQQVDA